MALLEFADHVGVISLRSPSFNGVGVASTGVEDVLHPAEQFRGASGLTQALLLIVDGSHFRG